jgi:hypothetical protein
MMLGLKNDGRGGNPAAILNAIGRRLCKEIYTNRGRLSMGVCASRKQLSLFFEYMHALFGYWLALMSAGPFLIDRMITWFCSRGRKWLEQWPHRQKALSIIMGIGVFFAGFQAWKEEHAAKIDVEQKFAASGSSQEWWAPLTSAETSALTSRASSLPPEDLTIACETIKCRDVADGIAAILQKSPGRKVMILHGGGLGISGVVGILINPDEPATRSLKDAIESTTTLKVTMGRDTRGLPRRMLK